VLGPRPRPLSCGRNIVSIDDCICRLVMGLLPVEDVAVVAVATVDRSDEIVCAALLGPCVSFDFRRFVERLGAVRLE